MVEHHHNNRAWRTMRARGLSTLEVLLAFTVLTLALSAVIMIVFGNQSLAITTRAMHEALYVGRSAVDVNQSGFDSLVSATYTVDTIFEVSRTVRDQTPCVKEVSADVRWSETARPLSLASLAVGFDAITARGNDCDVVPFHNEWDMVSRVPTTIETSGTYFDGSSYVLGDVTAMDVHHFDGVPYVVFGADGGDDDAASDIWIMSLADYNNPRVVDAMIPVNTPGRITAVDFIDEYIYAGGVDAAGNAYLYVFSVSDEFGLEQRARIALPGVNVLGNDGNVGTVYFYDNRVYVGIDRNVVGAELHVYDVTDRENPTPQSAIDFGGHNVHDLAVRDGYLFVASSDETGEVTIMSASDPRLQDATFVDLLGDADAETLTITGDTLIVGREGDTAFGMTEVTYYRIVGSPPTLELLTGYDFGPEFDGGYYGTTDYVMDVVAKENFVFVTTKEGNDGLFYILELQSGLLAESCNTIPRNPNELYRGIDTYGDYVFIGGNSPMITIYTDEGAVCSEE